MDETRSRIAATTERDLMERAERGYIHDPEFHARCERAAEAAAAALGRRPTNNDRALARHAAAFALVLAAEETLG